MERRRPSSSLPSPSSAPTHAKVGGAFAALGCEAWFAQQSDERQRLILGKSLKAWRKNPSSVNLVERVREHLASVQSKHHVAFTDAHEFFLSPRGTELLRAPIDSDLAEDGGRAGAITVVTGLHQLEFAIRDLTGRSPEQLNLTLFLTRRQERQRLLDDFSAGRIAIDIRGHARPLEQVGTRVQTVYFVPPAPAPSKGQTGGSQPRRRPSASTASPDPVTAPVGGSQVRKRPKSA